MQYLYEPFQLISRTLARMDCYGKWEQHLRYCTGHCSLNQLDIHLRTSSDSLQHEEIFLNMQTSELKRPCPTSGRALSCRYDYRLKKVLRSDFGSIAGLLLDDLFASLISQQCVMSHEFTGISGIKNNSLRSFTRFRKYCCVLTIVLELTQEL